MCQNWVFGRVCFILLQGPVLIWPNIAIVANAVFQEILALRKLQHILSTKRIIVQKNK